MAWLSTNIFALLVNSKMHLVGRRERMQPLEKCGFKLKNAGISETTGMSKRLYHTPHSKIVNVEDL